MTDPKARKAPPDVLDATDDWLFLCLDSETRAAVAKCTETGLNTELYSAETIKRVAKKKRIIVVSPSSGPGRKDAIDVIDRCKIAGAAAVREWVLLGLGAEFPTFADWMSAFDLGNTLWADRPWLLGLSSRLNGMAAGPKPSSNGDTLKGNSHVDTLDFAALKDEELGLVLASQVTPANVKWLWPYILARGEMALIAGEGGLGKSMFLLACATAASTGGLWPDQSVNAPVGHSIIVSAEDNAETTLRPRLEAMGANLDRVSFCRARTLIDRDGKRLVNPMSLQTHDYWKTVLDRHPDTVLFIVDPIPSYLGRGVNDRQNNEIREVLEPFIEDVIRPRNVCFYANTHLNKSVDARTPVQRITGSIAYANIPRNVHLIIRDPDQPDRRLFKQCKCNNGPDDLLAVAYRIQKAAVKHGEEVIETAIPAFEEQGVKIDLAEMMNGDKPRKGRVPVRSSKFAEWLWEQLKDGKPHPLKDLILDAREARPPLLATPPEGTKGSLTSLYNAKDRIPALHLGWCVDEIEVDLGSGGVEKLRKAWQLAETDDDQTFEMHGGDDEAPF